MEKIRRNKKMIIITGLLFLIPFIVSMLMWNRLPEQLPTHWNAAGEVDQYSSKAFALLALPLFLVAVHVICIWGTTADPKNKAISDGAFGLVLFICPVVYAVITYLELSVALGRQIDVSRLMTALISLACIFIGNYLPKSRRNYTMGIKIPWTLNSDNNWNATHRFGGILWMAVGIIGLVLCFLPFDKLFVPYIIVFVIASGIVPVIYSYIYYLRYEKGKE